jgi:hypothetical protein
VPSLYVIAARMARERRRSLNVLRRVNSLKVTVQNLFSIYCPVIDQWSIYDNSQLAPVLLAYGDPENLVVVNKGAFEKVIVDFEVNL